MPIEPARLNRRVELRRRARKDESDNTPWISLGETWARLEPVAGGAEAHQGRLDDRTRYRVLMRYRNDLAVGDRIRVDGRDLAVLRIDDPDGDRERSLCIAEARRGE